MSLLLLLGGGGPDGIIATIDGTAQEVLLSSFSIERTANGRDVLRCEVLSEDGSVRPALDEEVIFRIGTNTLFAGLIMSAREHGADGQPIEAITTEIVANDYKVLASRRFVNETIPAGTLKAALEVIVDYLPGCTLDPAQVNGPALEELIYDDANAEDVLNDLNKMTEYVWEIDHNKVFRMFEPGTVSAAFNVDEDSQIVIGDVSVEDVRATNYANRIIVRNASLRVTAEDATQIGIHGEWEAAYRAADTLAEDALQALADAILAASMVILKRLDYTVDDLRPKPGEVQTVDLPSRHVNPNTFLITDVNIGVVPDSDELWATVSVIEGVVFKVGFRETYRRWNSGSGRSVNGVGVGGGSGGQRYAYFLGGSGQEAVESSGPDWVPVAGGTTPGTGSFKVQINTVARGTTLATVTGQLKVLTPGNTVQARLYDVTDDTPVPGTSAVISSTDWEPFSFGVNLTPGSNFYELQLLPGLANEPVMGVGYVE